MTKFLKLLVAGLAAVGLAAGSTSVLAQKTEAPKKTEAAKPAAAAPAAAPKAEPMDINTASEKELASLKGIGEARSKAIVKGRPYKGKDELVQKKIIPQNVYDDVKDQIIAKQDAPKADAKKADAKPAEPKKDEKKK
jgi:DNA uptake protein ComE-like DNA-binding protein